MRLHELFEAPLPSDWDDAIYNNTVPFKKRVEYAKQMATKVGQGSSRIAFEIPYEGRKTILKVAKNRKGIAQNEAESEILGDYVLQDMGIMIPMIDFDDRNHTWIHTELASKVSNGQFKAACGGTPTDLVLYAKDRFHGAYRSFCRSPENIIEDADLTERFCEYVGNYIPMLDDYARIGNWGIYKSNIVIIDAGFNEDTAKLYQRG